MRERLARWLDRGQALQPQSAAAENLRLSEEQLQLATDTGSVGVWNWDIVPDRLTWTGTLHELHGTSSLDFEPTAAGFDRLLHPDDREAFQRARGEALERGETFEMEFRALRPSGGEVWLHTRARVVRENGRPVRMIGVTFDIDARKRAEIALRESEERFAKAFNASPLVLALSALDTGKLLAVNDAFVHVCGYSREEAIGRTTAELDLWNSEERQAELELLRKVGHVRNLELRFRSRRNGPRLGLLSAEKIIIGGEPHALTVVQDITESDRARAALDESERRLHLTLRAANAGAWTIDFTTNEVSWSDELRDLYGLDADMPHTLDSKLTRVHPDDREPLAAAIYAAAAAGNAEFRHEYRIVHPTRGVRWLEARGHVERGEGGGMKGLNGISIDIDRMKRVEEELREADRRKNEFLATLAHELRNPLAPIRNGLEILRLTGGIGERAEHSRAMMDRQLQQMVRLIDDLLDVSRISRGKIQLQREPIDLATALQSAIEASAPLIHAAGHQLTVHWPAAPIVVEGDATRLAQVFGNLLNNAAKYTNPGGRIEVTVSRDEREGRVAVRDNGIGIAPENLPKVFEMFAQVDSTMKRTLGGLGIGLSIARRLAEMHGGSLEARSEGVGTGTEFTVRLPLAAVAGEAHPLAAPSTPARHGQPLRVLIADDNADAAASLAIVLEMNGHVVCTAHNGQEAVRISRTFHPDVALLDIGMPQLDGYATCRQLRAGPGGPGMLIVALTGWGQAEDRRRSAEAGFDQHMVKPVDVQVLEQLLAQVTAHGEPTSAPA